MAILSLILIKEKNKACFKFLAFCSVMCRALFSRFSFGNVMLSFLRRMAVDSSFGFYHKFLELSAHL